jgi:hypothetical protein
MVKKNVDDVGWCWEIEKSAADDKSEEEDGRMMMSAKDVCGTRHLYKKDLPAFVLADVLVFSCRTVFSFSRTLQERCY